MLDTRVAKQVQWFRAKADMDRWMEEVEILEEEFRRYIRACQAMSSYWGEMSAHQWGPYKLPRSTAGFDGTCGYRVYAAQKADMFQEIAAYAEERFTDPKVGGAWAEKGEDLTQFLRARRPRMTVDWSVDNKEFDM